MYSTGYSCQILMKLEFSGYSFENCSNIKFHENPFSGSRVVPCGRTDGQTDRRNIDRPTDMTKLIVTFRNFAKAPKTLLYYFTASCNYTYLQNVIKLRLH
jgi:hypothetical protein